MDGRVSGVMNEVLKKQRAGTEQRWMLSILHVALKGIKLL